MILTLKIANKSFCMTLQPIMMHHNTEFGSKMFGGLENIICINIDILTLRCNLDLECNNPIFPQDALAYNNLSSDHAWLPKNQQFRRYSRNCHDHMNPCSDFDLKNSKPSFLHDTLAHNDASQYQA